jgi:hypothetical protein
MTEANENPQTVTIVLTSTGDVVTMTARDPDTIRIAIENGDERAWTELTADKFAAIVIPILAAIGGPD